MSIRFSIALLTIAGWVLPAGAQSSSRRATMVGGGGDRGKCTIEVEVDGVAEVAVSGDQGRLRTFSGQPAQWRRFECNGQLPRNPTDFRFRGIDGRGNVNLVSDPRDRGTAVVRIEDPKGGREGYTFDLEWSGGSYGNSGGFGRGGRYGRDDDYRRNNRLGQNDDFGNSLGGSQAVRACRDAITDRISRDGYTRVNILSAEADNNRGGKDRIFGRATARGRNETVDFNFTCNMNLSNGRVRSVDLDRR
jgi:hypothetical protein